MTVRSILFESPLKLILVLLVVEFVFLQVWSRRRTRRTGWLAVGGLIAIPLLLAVQYLVVTEHERITRVCETLADAVGDGDALAFARHIAVDFSVERGERHWDKAELMEDFQRVLTRWDVQEERLSGFEIEVRDHSAVASFRASCRLISTDLMVPYHVSYWRLAFAKRDGAWRVTHVQRVSSDREPRGLAPDLFR